MLPPTGCATLEIVAHEARHLAYSLDRMNVEEWLEARALRNTLVHEYVEDQAQFANDLQYENYARMLIATFALICGFARDRMGVAVPDGGP
jgi:hypothetical protein